MTTDTYGRHTLTALYHLFNVAWFFRRRIVEQIYERLLAISTQPQPSEIEITGLYDQLGRELMQISAQAIIRQIDSPLIVLRALGEEDPNVQSFVEELKSSSDLQQEVYEHLRTGPTSIESIVAPLRELANLNYRFLQKVSARFASVICELPLPSHVS